MKAMNKYMNFKVAPYSLREFVTALCKEGINTVGIVMQEGDIIVRVPTSDLTGEGTPKCLTQEK